MAQTDPVKQNTLEMGKRILSEDGLGNAITEIARYFDFEKGR